jgi:glycosyltransferase involved in cell wall biosynthesis
MKERLAFFLPDLSDGGAERIMLNLAEGITARGYDLDLVLSTAQGPFMNSIPASVRLVDLNAQRVLSSLFPLIGYLRRERPVAMLSVLHANIVALWARKLAGAPQRLILAEHNTLSSVVSGEGDLRWALFPKLANWFYPWADGIVAVSTGVADDLARTTNLPRERIQVIYNPIVTPDLFHKSRASLDHPWFQEGEIPVFLAVGRLTAQKGFDVLVRAFAQVRKNRMARLVILGEGDERPALEVLVKEYNLEQDVEMPGFLPNPYAYMARASTFVLSSRWEGLPTVLVEALSLGTPIVSTDCPSGPREILMNGKYGQLVPMDNPLALAAALEASLISKTPPPPRESWAPFTLESVVDQYIRILLGI